MLSNAYLVAKIGADTAENEPDVTKRRQKNVQYQKCGCGAQRGGGAMARLKRAGAGKQPKAKKQKKAAAGRPASDGRPSAALKGPDDPESAHF